MKLRPILIVLILIALCFGAARSDFTFTATQQNRWMACGSGASPGVYAEGVSEPAATALTADAFETSFQTMTIPIDWNYLYFRNSSTTAEDTSVYMVYFSDGGDYMPAFALTFTTGTQTCSTKSGYEFAYEITATEYLTTGIAKSPGGAYVAQYMTDRHWARKIGIVPLDLTHSAFLEITGN
jgi:hypothetical protein